MPSDAAPIVPTFFRTAADFRAWLKQSHKKEPALWVGYYRKATAKPSVTWEETVDEALCYGWIDGIRRSFDAESYVVRFSPRKPKSVWSQRNIERVEVLKSLGRMRKAGLDAYVHKDVHVDSGYAVGKRPKDLPAEMIAEFKKYPQAWDFYSAQPPGYREQSTAWVTGAKREDTRSRRLATLIEDSASGLRIKQFRRD